MIFLHSQWVIYLQKSIEDLAIICYYSNFVTPVPQVQMSPREDQNKNSGYNFFLINIFHSSWLVYLWQSIEVLKIHFLIKIIFDVKFILFFTLKMFFHADHFLFFLIEYMWFNHLFTWLGNGLSWKIDLAKIEPTTPFLWIKIVVATPIWGLDQFTKFGPPDDIHYRSAQHPWGNGGRHFKREGRVLNSCFNIGGFHCWTQLILVWFLDSLLALFNFPCWLGCQKWRGNYHFSGHT